ncbi:hypothetical protein B0H19DRAFT_1248173 [Mycena capillaripes]|nr:hypothetical protein B0H19DRAFT_1248173 [Mycena capillaripes]
MVNFLHNITALAGVATLCKISDFKNQLINLSGDFSANGLNAIISSPQSLGFADEAWLIVPQASGGTFTLRSVGEPAFFLSYAGAAAQTTDRSSFSGCDFKHPSDCIHNGSCRWGQAVNLIDTVTGLVLTSWVNPEPVAWSDPTTPITMENFNMPKSFMQSFTITLSSSSSSPTILPEGFNPKTIMAQVEVAGGKPLTLEELQAIAASKALSARTDASKRQCNIFDVCCPDGTTSCIESICNSLRRRRGLLLGRMLHRLRWVEHLQTFAIRVDRCVFAQVAEQ